MATIMAATKKDFIDLERQKETIQKKFKKIIVEREQKSTKEKKPWCRNCAQDDFELALHETTLKIQKGQYEENQEKIETMSIDFDVNNPDYEDFVEVGRSETTEPKMIDGSKLLMSVFYTDYVCKKTENAKYKHRRSVREEGELKKK